jgi:hypothetical protein
MLTVIASDSARIVDVAAAVILQMGGRFLLVRRPQARDTAMRHGAHGIGPLSGIW